MSKYDRRPGFKWLLIFCALVLLPLLIYLGYWQLQRAAEKERLIKAWNDDSFVLQSLSQLDTLGDQSLVQARIEGELLAEQWLLLDNRTRNGHVGYEVIGLLHTEAHLPVLPVNLGWIEASADRTRLPTIRPPGQAGFFAGRLRKIQAGFVLAEDQWASDWPKRVQSLDVERLQSLLNRPVLPWVLEVSEPPDARLTTDWPLASLQPERNLGYAVQWFAMAAALAGLLFWYWRKPEVKGVDR